MVTAVTVPHQSLNLLLARLLRGYEDDGARPWIGSSASATVFLRFRQYRSSILGSKLARIMHRFSTVAPKPSALTVLRDPQAGAPRTPRRTVQYACGVLGRAWRNALRTAFSGRLATKTYA